MSGGNIKVVVRCRPLNQRELSRGAKGLIHMDGDQTTLEPPQVEDTHGTGRSAGKRQQVFSFDKSYWSAGPKDEPGYASQHTLYDDLGVELLDHSFEGFNTCIFAYGQTGSGKSYSMMGYGADKGIIPLTTSELFHRVESRSGADKNLSYTVEVSYIEIYNEKVRDLLNPKSKDNLRVREHPSLGPYVEDLSRLAVEDYQQMMTLMDEGNKARTVASTNMNETSSRSHAVFTVILTQKRLDPSTKIIGEKVSKISLVDLAGSERQAATGATGTRLREGANINKSLTTLGKVIAALAQASSEPVKGKRKKDDFVPYRDSILTWLLKESLGGNSKTAMIAAISPADYEETLSTLRYADAAKRIKTRAVVNEDPNAKLIRELKEELETLRSRVTTNGAIDEDAYDPTVPPEQQIVTYRTKDGEIKKVSKAELQDQLQASEKLMESLNLTWEEKMAKTAAIHVERERALEELGISVDKHVVGVHAPQKHPSLVNLNEDPLMSECLIYQLKPGTTIAGALGGEEAHIRLSGSHILDKHCVFSNAEGSVTLEALPDARTFVNGKRVPPGSPVKLLNGFRVILGDFHVFRYNDPEAVRLERRKLNGSPDTRPESPSRLNDEFMDWSAARREVADIEKLGDQDLDKLYDDIVKVRTLRRRPDSRADLAEVESRFLASSQNGETLEPSGNPWAGPLETTLTTDSLQTPLALDNIDPVDLEHRSVSEVAGGLAPAFQLQLQLQAKQQDTALETQHLTRQLQTLALEVKRIRSQAAAARAFERDTLDPVTWTASELRLVQLAVSKWGKMRSFKMAEQILAGAVDVREANVIGHELARKVSYNSLVGDDSAGPPISKFGSNEAVDLEDVGDAMPPSKGPGVLIKVIDRESNAIYTWNYPRFNHQLTKMRHVRALKANPNYLVHFRNEGTFSDVQPPSHSYIGSSRIPLRLLGCRVAFEAVLPILCPYTMEAIGSCRVSLAHAISGSSGVGTPESSTRPLSSRLPTGQKHTFNLSITSVKGLSSGSFTSIHTQIHLSSLVGNDIASDETFVSSPVDLEKASVAHLTLKRSISIIVTPSMLEYMQSGYATVEFFAKLRSEYLDRLERWDFSREHTPESSGIDSPAMAHENGNRPTMRRCETDFLGPEHHDILCTVAIHELSANGSYEPVDVVNDTFHLHQGVQRRISIKLRHASGSRLLWTSVKHVATGDIRSVAKNVITSISSTEVQISAASQEPTYLPDGTSILLASGPWDTGSHACIHLDRKTSADHTVLVRLIFLVEVESLQEPASFSLDLPLKILPRDSRRRSSLMSYFAADKTRDSITSIFVLELSPPLAQSAQDLWRLDTACKHVAGEEKLGDWRPRGVGLIEDWQKARKIALGIAEKQATLAVLDAVLPDGPPMPSPTSTVGREELLGRCVELWRRHMDERYQVDLRRQSPEEEMLSKKLRKLLPDLETKLVPHVKTHPKVDTVIKAGTMAILRDPQANQWQKAYFVLRRPYLHIHPSHNEREDQIINLSKANVSPSPDVEALLGHRFAFTIFTPTNSYVLQAPNLKELNDWMKVIITSAG